MFVFEEFRWELWDEVLVVDDAESGGDGGVYVVGEVLVADSWAAVVVELGDFVGLGLEL